MRVRLKKGVELSGLENLKGSKFAHIDTRLKLLQRPVHIRAHACAFF